MEHEELVALGLTDEQVGAVLAAAGRDTAAREARIRALELDVAAESYAAGLRFTSPLARRAYIAELKVAGLERDETGALVGVEAFTKAMRAANPGAFAQDAAGGGGFAGKTAPPADEGNERDAIRAALFPARSG